MTPRDVVLALLAVGFVALVPGPVAGQASQPTFFAVVRSGGSMIPIAVFDGHEWWNRWPDASMGKSDLPPVPASLASIPSEWLPPGMRLPEEWRLYVGTGAPVRIKALRPTLTSMLMEDAIGLDVDYRREIGVYESDGALAVSGAATVGRFSRASRGDTDAIARQLEDRLAAIERAEIAQWVEAGNLPSDAGQRLRRVFRDAQQRDPAGLLLMRADLPFRGLTYYHLTGEKLYEIPGRSDASCKLNLSFDGVVATDRRGRVSFENVTASAWDGYCGDAAMSNNPIATIHVRDLMIWVGVEAVEDGFSYFLIDPHTRQPLARRR